MHHQGNNGVWMTQFEWQIEALIQVGFTETQRLCERRVTETSFIYSMLQGERVYECQPIAI